VFQGLDLSESHADRKTRILADGRLSLRGAPGARFFQGTLDNRFQVFLSKANSVARYGHRHLQNGSVDSERRFYRAPVIAWAI